MAATTRAKNIYQKAWIGYCKPLGVDPTLALEITPFTTKICSVTGFAARVKQGHFGFGYHIAAGTVTLALTPIGQVLSMDDRGNPLKAYGSRNYHQSIQVMLDGWKKEDLPMMKNLPVKVDIPKYLVQMAMDTNAGEGQKAIYDLTLTAFYYLLQVGEYTCKQRRNCEKQTVQLRIKDAMFFKRDK